MSKLIDITSEVFHRLTVLGRVPGRDNRGRVLWLVQCSCGSAPKLMRGDSLRDGHIKSCGCYKKERPWVTKVSKPTHGWRSAPSSGPTPYEQRVSTIMAARAEQIRRFGRELWWPYEGRWWRPGDF